MKLQALRNARRYENITTKSFEVRQKVRLWQPVVIEGKKAKLTQKWFGPYFIHQIKSEGRVVYFKDDEGNLLNTPVSVTRIWPWPKVTNMSQNTDDAMLLTEGVDKDLGDLEIPDKSEESDDDMIQSSGDDTDDSDSEEENNVPDIINYPDDDESENYFPEKDSESTDEDDEMAEQPTPHKNKSSANSSYTKPSVKKPELVDLKKNKYQLRTPPKLRPRKRLMARPLPVTRQKVNKTQPLTKD